jgi:hypothetical protein
LYSAYTLREPREEWERERVRERESVRERRRERERRERGRERREEETEREVREKRRTRQQKRWERKKEIGKKQRSAVGSIRNSSHSKVTEVNKSFSGCYLHHTAAPAVSCIPCCKLRMQSRLEIPHQPAHRSTMRGGRLGKEMKGDEKGWEEGEEGWEKKRG